MAVSRALPIIPADGCDRRGSLSLILILVCQASSRTVGEQLAMPTRRICVAWRSMVCLCVCVSLCANAARVLAGSREPTAWRSRAALEHRPLLDGRVGGRHVGVMGATLRLRGGAGVAKAGGLFAASISRWQHDDIMQVHRARSTSFFAFLISLV